jgi:hypothetical protein
MDFDIFGDATYVPARVAAANGIVSFTTDGGDEDAIQIESGGTLGSIAVGSGKRAWFEGKIALQDVNDDTGFFLGVGEAAAMADPIVDTSANLITESMIGFRKYTAEDHIDAIAQLNAGAEIEIAANVTNHAALGDDAEAMVDGTFYKLGMRFDGDKTGYVQMAFICAFKSSVAAANAFYVDWLRVAWEI